MNKKVRGIIIIILGSYLLIGNTIMSILLNYAGPNGFNVPVSSTNYWRNWWNNYGLVTVTIAIVGVIIISFGIRNLIRNNRGITITME